MGYKFAIKDEVLMSEPRAFCKWHYGWEEWVVMTPPETTSQEKGSFIEYRSRVIGRGNSAWSAWKDASKNLKREARR